VAERLDAQLDEATRAFLGNDSKGMIVNPDRRSARVSSIFKWFADDFAAAGGVVGFIRAHPAATVRDRIAGLEESQLSYLDYDWSLNDRARARVAP
jgi:hypothetical protein